MNILFDTDVILDLALERPSFFENAAALFNAHEDGRITGYVTAVTLANVFYIGQKLRGRIVARAAVERLTRALSVCSMDQGVANAALALAMTDYEDALQAASAFDAGLDAIVTRNASDYAQAPLPVFSPAELLSRLTPPSGTI